MKRSFCLKSTFFLVLFYCTNASKVCEITASLFQPTKSYNLTIFCDGSHEIASHTKNTYSGIKIIIWNGLHALPNRDFHLKFIYDPSSVTNLTIEQFRVPTVFYEEFTNLTQLQHLVLRNNKIQEISFGIFTINEKLISLQLFDNLIRKIDGSPNNSKSYITKLKISEPNLVLEDFSLERFVNLIYLSINCYHINPNFLKDLQNLTTFEVRTAIGFDEVVIEKAESLEELKITESSVANFLLSNDLSITTLNLGNNKLKSTKFLENRLKKLKNFDVSDNSLTTVSGVETLDSIESINLSKNLISKFNLYSLKQKTLMVLNISFNKIDQFDMNQEIIYDIWVDGNPFDCHWLSLVQHFSWFNHIHYNPSYDKTNVKGLPCNYYDLKNIVDIVDLNFISSILIVGWCLSSLLIVLIVFCIYVRVMWIKSYMTHVPFYRTLIDYPRMQTKSDNVIEMRTLRKLPPCPYEEPLSIRYHTCEAISETSSIYEDIVDVRESLDREFTTSEHARFLEKLFSEITTLDVNDLEGEKQTTDDFVDN